MSHQNQSSVSFSSSPFKDHRQNGSEQDSGTSTFNDNAQMITEADNTSHHHASSMLMADSSGKEISQQDQQAVMLPRVFDTDYVRNILLKYLEYMASGENEKEALTLEKVLFTVLNASS